MFFTHIPGEDVSNFQERGFENVPTPARCPQPWIFFGIYIICRSLGQDLIEI